MCGWKPFFVPGGHAAYNLRMQRITCAGTHHGSFGEGVALVAANAPTRYTDMASLRE